MIKKFCLLTICIIFSNLSYAKYEFDEELAKELVPEIQKQEEFDSEIKRDFTQEKINALNKAVSSKEKTGGVSIQNNEIKPKKFDNINALKPNKKIMEDYFVIPESVIASNLKTNSQTGTVTNFVIKYVPVPVENSSLFLKLTKIFFNITFGLMWMSCAAWLGMQIFKICPWKKNKPIVEKEELTEVKVSEPAKTEDGNSSNLKI